jgi:putative lumazine-binding protein
MNWVREMSQGCLKMIRHGSCLAACFLVMLVCSSCPDGGKSAADTPEVRAFLTRYFATWSARDMDGYGACFDPQARILYVSKEGQIMSDGTINFLHGQKLAHEQSATPMTELPLQMTIQGDARVVQAAVTWVLQKGPTEERGTDFFTLRRDGEGWKIVSLVFYGE